MSASQLSSTEERLFLLLDSIERLNEQTERQQEIVKITAEQVKAQQARFINDVDAIKKASVQHFVHIESQTVKLQHAMIDVVSDNIAKGVNQASAEILKSLLDDIIKSFEKDVKSSAESLVYSTITAKRIADETAEQYRTSFGWKILLLWGGSIVLIASIILAFFIFYVPSYNEISERRAAVATLKKQLVVVGECGGEKCVKVDVSKCRYGQEKYNANRQYCLIK